MASSSTYEQVSRNPFLVALRTSFVKLYRTMAEKQHTLLVPSTATCEGLKITQVLIETHVLQPTHIPGNFLNLLGQGVEYRGGCVYTSFAFKEQRVCNVLHEENMYDYGSAFKVVCIDRPLQGEFQHQSHLGNMLSFPNSSRRLLDEQTVLRTANEWLSGDSPATVYINCLVDQFKHTYVLVSGFEHNASATLQQLSRKAAAAIGRQKQFRGTQQKQFLQEVMERYVYSKVYGVLWNHLQDSLGPRERLLQKTIRQLRKDIPTLLKYLQANPALQDLDLSSPAEALSKMQIFRTPHEKLECLQEVCQLLYKGVEKHTKPSQQQHCRAKPTEVTGDDVLALLVECLVTANLRDAISNASLMDMYLSQKSAVARMEKASYVFTTFHSALTYVLHQQLVS